VTTAGGLKKHVKMRVREAERFAVSVMSQLRLQSGTTVDALICNLSSKGFMVNSPEYLPTDSHVQLVVPGVGPCDAVVIWSFCGDTGARFVRPVELDRYWDAVLPQDEHHDDSDLPPFEPVSASQHLGRYLERGAERISAEGTFALRAGDFHMVDAEIVDISTLGLKGSCPRTLSIGSLITVDIPGIGAVEAEVKWQLADRFGAMFLEAIDLARCEWSAVRARFA
jgi:hypothetical protein